MAMKPAITEVWVNKGIFAYNSGELLNVFYHHLELFEEHISILLNLS